jgi:hypothetical protein
MCWERRWESDTGKNDEEKSSGGRAVKDPRYQTKGRKKSANYKGDSDEGRTGTSTEDARQSHKY